MNQLLIHDRDVATSVRAAMLFPDDEEKARTVVGWHLAGGPLAEYAKSHPLDSTELLRIAKDAHDFQKIREEVGKREVAGYHAGAVVLVLWGLLLNYREL